MVDENVCKTCVQDSCCHAGELTVKERMGLDVYGISFLDEHGGVFTLDELRKSFVELKRDGKTEIETLYDYIRECTGGNGTLTRVKVYAIAFDYYPPERVVVDEWESEADALDKLIDQLESKGSEGCFLSQEQIDRDNIYPDMYVTGGNHCRNLYHGGNLNIRHIC